MAIYKNEQALKAYKGDYGPVNLYLGENKVAGWQIAQQQGKDLVFDGTYKDNIDELKIYGKSLQKHTIQGKNLVDKDRLKKPESWRQGNSYHYLPLKVKSGASYAMSMSANHSAGKGYYLNLDTRPGAGGSGANICWLAHPSETAAQTRYKFTAPSDVIYFNIFPKPTGQGLEELFEEILIDLQIEQGTEYTGYQPFVPNSPSPDYPAEIASAENAAVSSEGRNMADFTSVTAVALNIIAMKQVDLKGLPKIFISCEIDNTKNNFPARIRLDGVRPDGTVSFALAFSSYIDGGKADTVSLVKDNLSLYEKISICYDTSLGMTPGGRTVYRKLMVCSEPSPYQPYMRTQASFGGTLRAVPVSGGGYTYTDSEGAKWVADTVELSGGRVYYVQRVNSILVNCIGIYKKLSNVIRFDGGVTADVAGMADSALLCDRLERKSAYWLNDVECIFWHTEARWPTHYYYSLYISRLGISESDTDAQIKEKLNAWLAEHPLTLQYILNTPLKTDITDTAAGQTMLSLLTYWPYTHIYGDGEISVMVKQKED